MENISLEQLREIEAMRLLKKGFGKKRLKGYLMKKYGISQDEAEYFYKSAREILKGKFKPDWMENPPTGMTKIYDKILAIEAQKGDESLFPKEYFRHDFKKDKTHAEIWGLPDGSLLIKSKKGKKLWKNFNY